MVMKIKIDIVDSDTDGQLELRESPDYANAIQVTFPNGDILNVPTAQLYHALMALKATLTPPDYARPS